LYALRQRRSRWHIESKNLHCRLNEQAVPIPKLDNEYERAFEQWDSDLAKTISGYRDNCRKRYWFLSMRNWPYEYWEKTRAVRSHGIPM